MQTTITITQEQLDAMANSIQACAEYLRANNKGTHADIYLANELNLAHKACAYIGHELYEAWSALPNGSALKDLYAEDIWSPEPPLI